MNGAPMPEVEVGESAQETLQVEDEANVHSNEKTGKPKTQEKDGETAQQVMSGTEVPELSTEYEDANKWKTFGEQIASSEPEKQWEKPAGMNDTIMEKVSSEEV